MAATPQAPSDLIDVLDLYLVRKAPVQIPAAAREWIVKFGPWITAVLLLLDVFIVLPLLSIALGFVVFLMPVATASRLSAGAGLYFWLVLLVAQMAMFAMAMPGLLARKTAGWRYFLYAQFVGIALALVTFSFDGTILGIIGLYIVFQVRSLYHG